MTFHRYLATKSRCIRENLRHCVKDLPGYVAVEGNLNKFNKYWKPYCDTLKTGEEHNTQKQAADKGPILKEIRGWIHMSEICKRLFLSQTLKLFPSSMRLWRASTEFCIRFRLENSCDKTFFTFYA